MLRSFVLQQLWQQGHAQQCRGRSALAMQLQLMHATSNSAGGPSSQGNHTPCPTHLRAGSGSSLGACTDGTQHRHQPVLADLLPTAFSTGQLQLTSRHTAQLCFGQFIQACSCCCQHMHAVSIVALQCLVQCTEPKVCSQAAVSLDEHSCARQPGVWVFFCAGCGGP